MKYKIFDTLDEFNKKNAEMNKSLGFPTTEIVELEKTTVNIIDDNGNYSTVDAYKDSESIILKSVLDNSVSDADGIIIIQSTDGIFHHVMKSSSGYTTIPVNMNYSNPILTEDDKYAMPILDIVSQYFNENELTDIINIKL